MSRPTFLGGGEFSLFTTATPQPPTFTQTHNNEDLPDPNILVLRSG
jgi:hypothetical protein